ncbi:MAG TPA: hypothetical protein VFP87_04180 [Chitinophagaceae bacterium]|nr:hypothetical protein [Chitinophagaceae bacterium]
MKSKTLILFSAILLSTALTGCYKDIISPGQDPNGPPQYVSFSGDLVPIFSKNCALSGCHDGAAHNPALTPENAYTALINGGYVNTIVPTNSIIYGEVNSGSMPPTGALKASDVQKILDWIRNGAPNN